MLVGWNNVDRVEEVAVLDGIAGKEGDKFDVKGGGEVVSVWDRLKDMVETVEMVEEDRGDAGVGSLVADMEVELAGLVEVLPLWAVADIAAAGNKEDTAGTADRDSTVDNQGTVDSRDTARTASVWVSLTHSIL